MPGGSLYACPKEHLGDAAKSDQKSGPGVSKIGWAAVQLLGETGDRVTITGHPT